MEKSIEKPWGVYCGPMMFPMNVGLITRESPTGSLYLMYVEGQFYPEELWDPKYVKRFPTPEEAVGFLSERKGINFSKALERVYENFPKAIKKEKIKGLCEVILAHKNILFAQSSPNCKEKRKRYTDLPPSAFENSPFGTGIIPSDRT